MTPLLQSSRGTSSSLLHHRQPSEPASMAVDVKVPYRLSATTLSADMGASAHSPATAARQQVGTFSCSCQTSRAGSRLFSKPSPGQQAAPILPAPPSRVPCNRPTSHGKEHHLETRGLPITSPFRQMETQSCRRRKRNPQLRRGMGTSSSRAAYWPLLFTW